MSSEPTPGLPPAASAATSARAAAPLSASARLGVTVLGCIALAALVASLLLWQRLWSVQEQLARQSADSGAQAIEARSMARQAQDLARDTAAKQAVADARLNEVTLQRRQLEELIQSLSRTRDENLVVDIDSGLRLAQQQAQLTGNLEPLVAALRSAQQRIERSAQPRLAPVQQAIEHDLDRLGRASVTDTAGLLGRIDDLIRQVDDLPLLNAVAHASAMRRMAAAQGADDAPATPASTAGMPRWQAVLTSAWEVVRDEMRGLLRITRIDRPDAMLLAPEQAFFLRENLKLTLLNARLGVLARQLDSARSDLAAASTSLNRYFDPASRRTQAAATTLQQAQAHLKIAQLPGIDDSLAALATAAAGR
ncbi:uroporphyrinogen-III C-methyltransferase [Paracidovorax wautersii]|uniref:uroporphyrinogen-III C-methyltransferase n=1 Tax=Paracidovorax wautersii TaxID=1177982 RepID=UPI0031DB0686